MSNLDFSPSEIRLATATLAALAVIVPTIYFLRNDQPQESTPHVRTFRKFLKAYSTRRHQALVANASRDFTHVVLPTSLQIPARGLQPFKMHATTIFSLFEDFSMVPQPPGQANSVHFSRETSTVIAHCKMGGKINGADEKGRLLVQGGITEWWTECVLFVVMDQEGRQVLEVREFVHSAKAEELKLRLTGVLEG